MERILELSYKHKLSHIGSCLTMYPILENIYKNKQERDIVILSAGHAGVAQYVLLERYSNGKINADELIEEMGVHPERNIEKGIHVSSGSLGTAVLVAIGFALADPSRMVYCLLSDGECAEGSVWEALRFCTEKNLTNFRPYVNSNGYSAYDQIDRSYLEKRLVAFCPWIQVIQTQNPEPLGGLNAHYHVLKKKEEISEIMSSMKTT
jgi:transketolase